MEQSGSDKPPVARRGSLLVVRRGAGLPAICVKCGQPATSEPLTSNYTWHTPWLYLVILLGVLIYVILALIVRKKFELSVPLCQAHREQQQRRKLVGLGLFIGPIVAAIFLSGYIPEGYGVWWALAIVITSLSGAFYFDSAIVLRPAYIGDHEAHFKRAGEPFLSQLPAVS